jgi:hypothetical protein
VKTGDLPSSLSILPKATDKPLNDEASVINVITLLNDVSVRGDQLRIASQAEHGIRFSLSEHRARRQAFDKRLKGTAHG